MKKVAKILSAIIMLSMSLGFNTYAADSSDTLSASLNSQISKELSKLNTSDFDSFSIKILRNNNLVLEDGVWYTYIYSKYLSTGKGAIPNKTDLRDAGINSKTDILLLDDSIGVGFIHEYKKVKVINDDIISDIANKNTFLKELADEKKGLQNDTDVLFTELKAKTIKLTDGLSDGEKIATIYDYILKNTTYSKTFDVNNKEIFSGIYTYKNNDGICTGYAKLALYMLSFAGIQDTEIVRGNVIDIDNFLDAGHAWIRIGDKYFDPTFDDPIGNTNAKTLSEYKYFSIPKDLFYSNRYEYGTLPSGLEKTTLTYRKDMVNDTLKKLATKYSDKNYNLLKNIKTELSFNY